MSDRPGIGLLRPTYDTVLGDPMREGRLRLDRVHGPARVASIVGLLALFATMGGLLFGDLWRHGSLIYIQRLGDRVILAPRALLPATCVAMFVAWALVGWGAAYASAAVRVAVGAAFLALNAPLGDAPLTSLDAHPSAFPGVLVAVGYWAVPAALLALAIVRFLPRVERWIRPVLVAAVVLGCGAFFAGHLWALPLQEDRLLPVVLPATLFSAASNAQYLLVPLLGVTAVVLIAFSRDVAQAAASPLRRLGAVPAKLALLGLIALKVWIQVIRHGHEWTEFLTGKTTTAVVTAVLVFAFAGAFVALRRSPAWAAVAAQAKEPLIFGCAVALAVATLILLAAKTVGDFLTSQLGSTTAPRLLHPLTSGRLLSVVDVVVWVVAVGLGIVWVRRTERGTVRHEAAQGLVVVGLWAGALFTLELFNVNVPFGARFADLVVTAGIATLVVIRWRRTEAEAAASLAAALLFVWLVSTKGHFLLAIDSAFGLFGSLFGLPVAAVVVFGVVLTLLTDSGFARGDSRRFPARARVLLWVGYLLLSMAIANLTTGLHAADTTSNQADRAWFYIGIPLAVWLLARLPLTRVDAEPPPEPAPSLPAPAG